MPKSLNCPNCSAPLNPEGVQDTTVVCEYCGSTVVIPSLARQPISQHPPPSNRRTEPGTGRKTLLGCLAIIALGLVGGLILFLFIFPGDESSGRASSPEQGSVSSVGEPRSAAATVRPSPTPVPQPTVTPPFASELVRFGGEGIGAGLLDDVREIAVDREGRIFAADRMGGRIQVFTPEGDYSHQLTVEPDTPVLGLATLLDGDLLVVQAGRILRFNPEDGSLLAELSYPGGELFYHDVTVTPTGELIAITTEWVGSVFATHRLYYELTWLDEAGNILQTASLFDHEQGDKYTSVAVDGSGNVYALGTARIRNGLHDVIFLYDAAGNFLSLIDGGDNQATTPGSFNNAQSIAVDGWGRIYLGDSEILVLDPSGRYLETIQIDRRAEDMQFDGPDKLVATNREEIFSFLVPKPVD